MLDEEVLQYRRRGRNGRSCELVIGFDFGTSATKVIVQAPDLPGSPAYAVDFGALGHAAMPMLLPTQLWTNPQGSCSLKRIPGGREFRDIKVALFANEARPKREGPSAEAVATAYLAHVLRRAREWFLTNRADLLRDFRELVWSLNLGVPSPCAEDNEQNRRFRRVGQAGWKLSQTRKPTVDAAQAEVKRLMDLSFESWESEDGACDFEIIPEIAAGAVGYALSAHRREGVHVMVDVGASTLDVCIFLLHNRGGDRYSLLSADVQQLGTVSLHLERIKAIQRVDKTLADELLIKHDPLTAIADTIEPYLRLRNGVSESVAAAEKRQKVLCCRMIQRVVWHVKLDRAPMEQVWKKQLPMILIGGGSHLSFFSKLTNEISAWLTKQVGNEGVTRTNVPVPRALKTKAKDYRRLAVAWGLSHRKFDIGEIIPADRIADIPRAQQRDWTRSYVSKDDV